MKKQLIVWLIVMFIFLSSINQLYCNYADRKDPFLAGVLSWYMPGLGQFYAGKYLKGSIFWAVENTLFISALLTVADLNFSVNEEIGFQFSIKPKETISKKQKTIGITLAASYVIFHIYNVIDAVQTTKNVNFENALKYKQSRLNFDYKLIADNNYCTINYKF